MRMPKRLSLRGRRTITNLKSTSEGGKLSIARVLGAAGLSVALLATPAFAEQNISLTVAAGQPPAALPSLALVGKFFIPEVNKRIKEANLDVQIQWKEAYAGSLLKPYQMLDGIKDGLADIGFVPTIFFPDKLPLEQITLIAPFLTTDIELLDRVMNRLHKTIPAFPAQYDKFNQVRLGGTGADFSSSSRHFRSKSLRTLRVTKSAPPERRLPGCAAPARRPFRAT